MSEIVFDASFLVGLIDEKDKWHKEAVEIMNEIITKNMEGVIFDCIANEVITVIGRRLKGSRNEEYDEVMKKATPFVSYERIMTVYQDVEDWYDGILNKVKELKGKLSFHDALILEAASALGIHGIVSFDEGFDGIENVKRIKSRQDVS